MRHHALALLLAALLLAAGPARGQQQPADGRPVVCLHGFNGDASTFDPVVPLLRDAGFEPIALTWEPADGRQGLLETATEVVGPMIQAAIAERGYPEGQRISLLTHSMGGIVARVLVEQQGWETRLERLVMLSLPARGARTGLGNAACGLPPADPWRGAGCDLRQDAPLLAELGTAPPPDLAARYLTLATLWRGSPMPGGGDFDGDGRWHGNDGVVASESGALVGVPLVLWEGRGPVQHTRVTCNDRVAHWAVAFLRDGTVPEVSGDHRQAVAGSLCR